MPLFRLLFCWTPWRTVGGALCLATAIFDILLPRLLGEIVEELPLIGVQVLFTVAIVMIAGFMRLVLRYCFGRYQAFAISQVEFKFRRYLLRKITTLPVGQVNQAESGTWLERLCFDVSFVCETFHHIGFQALGFFMVFSLLTVMAMTSSVMVGIPISVLLLSYACIMLSFRRILKKSARRKRRFMCWFYDGIYSFLNILALSRVFRTAGVLTSKFCQRGLHYAKAINSASVIEVEYAAVSGIASVVLQCTTLVCLVYAFVTNRIGMGSVVTIQMCVSNLVLSAEALLQVFPDITRCRETIENIAAWSDCQCEACSGRLMQRGRSDPTDNMVVLTNVSFCYCVGGKMYLDGVCLEIKRGQHVAITGVNGVGKTTLLRIITGVEDPIDGSCVNYSHSQSIIPQKIVAIKDSVLENVRLYDDKITRDDVRKAIEKCGLSSWVDKRCAGLDSIIDGASVSGGELQRLGIARALVRGPDLLVVDEVHNNLDIVEKKRICEVLNTLRPTCTIITITHDDHFLANCDAVYELNMGKLIVVDR